jgi:hypothetical protein
MKAIVKTARTAQAFWSQVYSGISNLLDFGKDLLLEWTKILSGGLTLAIDVPLTLALIFLFENPMTEATNKEYEQVIDFVRQTAEAHLQKDEPQADTGPKSWEDMSEEEQEEYRRKLFS